MYRPVFFILMLLVCTGISCTKVDELSDEATIESFTIISSSEGIELAKDQIQIVNNVVSIPLESGRKNFPLTIQAKIVFSSTTHNQISINAEPLNLQEFIFTDVYTPYSFYLISESGVPHLAKIVLKDKLNAEIEQVELEGLTEGIDYQVMLRNNQVRIQFMHQPVYPLTIQPKILKTSTARFKDYEEGSSMTFENPSSEKSITLIADNNDERVWHFRVVPAVENGDFEKWINVGTALVNIDPVPGVGYGWATANNQFVQGSQPIEYAGGFAAQLTTGIQKLYGLGLGDLITAATIFTGHFEMKISELSNPPAMTFFGIPFITRPASVSLKAKYVAGSKLQQSVERKGNQKYELVDIPGIDEGRVWVKIMHWEGEGELAYHEKDIPGLTILGEGELIFDGSDSSLASWQDFKINIKYNSIYDQLEPTHIAIVATSSRQGDYFIGAEGSTLTLDDVNVNY